MKEFLSNTVHSTPLAQKKGHIHQLNPEIWTLTSNDQETLFLLGAAV
jgi:hypothetical protein